MSTAEQSYGRYQIESTLGEGGAGIVYLARDRDTGEQLALKKLLRVDAKSILRLKREFRSMQVIDHPHIVKLYDMGQAGDSWYLTMEYLDGPDLHGYLRAHAPAAANAVDAVAADLTSPAGLRLLSAFHQLARGIHALHEAGMLHRDLKPSNVRVVADRVVVLDFGLVRELDRDATRVTEEGGGAGTPAYMAPEQIEGAELGAAADWYAFGVMLYEAVAGLLPFGGPLGELLRGKMTREPLPLHDWAPDAPGWMVELCASLLRRRPLERPSGASVLERFEAAARAAHLPTTGTENVLHTEVESGHAPRELFGRDRESAQLWSALRQVEQGRAAVVHVRGESGAGKSALVERFLYELEARRSRTPASEPLVLRSRCYELEAMPFKALDGVVDALASHLSHLPDLDVAHLLPQAIAELVQLFPVLGRLRVAARLAPGRATESDVVLQRRRAESALRALLDNLAARAPIVLWIDDLQWGDLDSARILESWLSQPSSLPILYLFSYRSDEAETSSCLRRLLRDEGEPRQIAEQLIELAPLSGEDVRALCEQRLPDTPERDLLVERVVREAQGNPFLATQLMALAEAKCSRGDGDLHALSIDVMVAQTSALLSADAQQLLNVLAIAGRPILPKLALEAAGVERGGRGLVHSLRGLSLVRTREVGGTRMLEVHHARIRERIGSSLSHDERRSLHQRLLDTLEFSAQADPDWLHRLALGAGQDAQALHHGKAAAERANASMAFERAAGLYRVCLELAPQAERGELWSKRALALARSGRALESAHAALETIQHAPAHEKVLWMRRAAGHLLRSGHYAEGEALIREVLAAKQIAVPATDAGLRAAIAWERAWIRLRGSDDVVGPAGAGPPELLERFDLLMSLHMDTYQHAPLRAALFQARALRCALEAGEPVRLSRVLVAAATSSALYGSAQAARESDALLARAARINARLDGPDELTLATNRAVCAYALGRLHEVLAPLEQASRLLRSDAQQDPTGNYQRRIGIGSVRIGVQQFFGEYARCDAELRSLYEEAVSTNNRSAQLHLTRAQTVAEHVAGQAERARTRLQAQHADLPPESFGLLHVLHMVSVMSTASWLKDFAWADAHLHDAWPRFLRSPTRETAYLGLSAYSEHARLLLNRCVHHERRDAAARLVRDDLRALERLPLPWASAFVQRYRARVALLRGEAGEGAACLRLAAARFADAGMKHESARDGYALGLVLASPEGVQLRERSAQRMREMTVADPEADVRAYYPELFQDP